ncbi:ankyrin, partial [Piromyces finnis]
NILKRLITRNNESINIRDDKGNTLLHIACQRGDKDMVKCLIDNGANIFIQNNNDDTPVALAEKNDDKKKININAQNNKGLTLLHYAWEQGNEKIVKYLIEKGADTSIKSNNRSTSLHWACKSKSDNINLVKYLIEEKGLDIKIKDKYEKIPFHYACYKGNENIVKYLIKKGANPRAKNSYGRISLHFACGAEKENINLVKYLIEVIGLDINAQNKNRDDKGNTLLHIACQRGDKDMVKYLIDNGANIFIQNNNNDTPMTLAKKNGDKNIVNLLNTENEYSLFFYEAIKKMNIRDYLQKKKKNH